MWKSSRSLRKYGVWSTGVTKLGNSWVGELGLRDITENGLKTALRVLRPNPSMCVNQPPICMRITVSGSELTRQLIWISTNWLQVNCLMGYAAFNTISVLSRRFLGKLPVLMVHLFWLQSVSLYANPATLSAKEGSHYYHFKSLWYDPARDYK